MKTHTALQSCLCHQQWRINAAIRCSTLTQNYFSPWSAPLQRNRGMWECWLQTWSSRNNTRCRFQKFRILRPTNRLSPLPAWHKPENSPHDSCIWAQSTPTIISSHCTKGVARLFWWLTIPLSLWIILISNIMGCYSALVRYTEEPPSSMFTWVEVTQSSFYCWSFSLTWASNAFSNKMDTIMVLFSLGFGFF